MSACHWLASGNIWKANSLWAEWYPRTTNVTWSRITPTKTIRRASTLQRGPIARETATQSSVEHGRESAAPLDAALVGLHAHHTGLRQGQHPGHAFEHRAVFLADRPVEGDHLFSGHREVVV